MLEMRSRAGARAAPCMSDKIRIFVAILLSDEVRRALAQEVNRLRSVAPAVGWIQPENLHLTLKFLGHIPPETLARVEAGLAEAVADQRPLTLAFAGLGAFPSAERPRVIWAGVTNGAEMLVALQARVEDALARQEISREERPFHPHLTVARVREPRHARPLFSALKARENAPFGDQEVSAVHLMRSDLHPQGARYTVLRTFPLVAR